MIDDRVLKERRMNATGGSGSDHSDFGSGVCDS
jgi:hypothetical protein